MLFESFLYCGKSIPLLSGRKLRMFVNNTHESAHEALKKGLLDEAIHLYTLALEENPGHPDIYSDRGVAYLHKQDKAMCMLDLDKAVEIQPNYAFRYACRAYAKNNFGDIDAAIIDYELALELDPEDAVAHNNLGLLLEQKGYKLEAEKKFRQADRLSKIEDHLLHVIDELEGKDEIERVEIPPGSLSKPNSFWKEITLILTSKKHFREFIRFIKNGFKI